MGDLPSFCKYCPVVYFLVSLMTRFCLLRCWREQELLFLLLRCWREQELLFLLLRCWREQ